ncbi:MULTISPECIES: CaiB/BaiF CoA transferase family protein [Haloferax]|uniref:Succinyl-CoA:(R)-benzylsuccinate CoA-transferase subunit BbsF n=4 Tax=Haloferax TaxID=2251 RepID=A0A0D6JX16_9EURY|nr:MULTISPECIES: CoA transferase [Haloferax]ELZ88613.1 CAIB/BAIF family protein [Haloferax sulfurifontis ATCC BAA-897]EMA07404.1 CAIB/BAIF family protein [Haloferax denitrificans ATCC 35960]MDS0242389.1 CoA transferase [Haloferax sp. S2CR25]MDS0445510.1 CoA transferase [Haloferax sp. S2CR25-2]CQR53990.1 Succinyl-CoA:(R)-benzylsuccinate CoA-transferase subunit BbsF [Haloferax massiliensis]
MTNDTNGPLDGLVVLEAGSMISGPTVGRFLADFGATVIKIEHPAFGDHIRRFGPQKDGVGLWHKYLSRNKQSITLNISTDEGAAVFEDLVGEADLLIENFRPGTLERWNVGWERLSEVNDDLVMLRMSGFGQTGPYAERPGFGTLAEAMSGFAYLNGFPDSPPLLPPTGLADNIAALFSTFAVMFALYHRDVHGGGGQYIDTSLIEPIFGLLGPQPLRYDQLGEIESRSGNRSTSSAPRNVYRTGDDRWVAISASAQPLAERTFDAIDRPDLKDDPRFETNEDRLEHVDELDAIIQDWMDDHSREEVLDAFEAADATLAPVYNVEDILNDEHYAAREAFLTVDDPDLGEAVVQNAFPKFSETPGRVDHLGPSLGEHNDAVYRDRLGYDESVLSDLEAEDVI